MAGPLSSEEIEDVVSSVRRLVSNELSPRRLSRDLGADRLLLTPALRVVSEISPLAPLVLQEKVEEPSAPEAQTAPFGPEEAEPAEAPDDDAVQLIEAEWEDEIWVAPEAPALGEVALGLEEAEVLVADHRDEPLDPDTADAAFIVPEPVQAKLIPIAAHVRRSEGQASRIPAEEDDLQAATGPVSADESGNETSAEQALPADDMHEEPVSAESQPTDAWLEASQPDAEAARHGDAVPDAHTSGELPDPAVPHEGPAPRMPTEIIDADGTPLAVLDEAALQDIVRQMIREELQGDLGERITRNVRKLVRAEINRALMARDLD